ncbi:MAG: helix-turn-helix domain-containing protein [Clostridia bacterium]
MNLNDVLTGPEAAVEWGLGESTVRNAAASGRFLPEEARRAGKNWLITRQGMERVFGKAKLEKL